VLISTATLAGEAPALLGNPRAEETHRFLNESERRFLLAAVDRLIPADERWPGAAEAGVVNYIDLQMRELGVVAKCCIATDHSEGHSHAGIST